MNVPDKTVKSKSDAVDAVTWESLLATVDNMPPPTIIRSNQSIKDVLSKKGTSETLVTNPQAPVLDDAAVKDCERLAGETPVGFWPNEDRILEITQDFKQRLKDKSIALSK